jgi:hypothetical protein
VRPIALPFKKPKAFLKKGIKIAGKKAAAVSKLPPKVAKLPAMKVKLPKTVPKLPLPKKAGFIRQATKLVKVPKGATQQFLKQTQSAGAIAQRVSGRTAERAIERAQRLQQATLGGAAQLAATTGHAAMSAGRSVEGAMSGAASDVASAVGGAAGDILEKGGDIAGDIAGDVAEGASRGAVEASGIGKLTQPKYLIPIIIGGVVLLLALIIGVIVFIRKNYNDEHDAVIQTFDPMGMTVGQVGRMTGIDQMKVSDVAKLAAMAL